MPAYYLEVIVVVLGLTLLLVEAFVPLGDRRSLAWLAALGIGVVLCLSFLVSTPEQAEETGRFSALYATDGLALFYKRIALLTTLLVLLMSADYRKILHQYTDPERPQSQAGLGEFFTLPVFACAGLMWMASATDLISIFVSLEAVTMTFYVLVAFMRRNVGSLEAGVKYLILGALSTGFLVYGITWLYGITGQTELSAISEVLKEGAVSKTAALFAFALILVALGFKVGAVPFQFWIPDVYQGAPTPITAFLSVGSKAAGFVVLLRVSEPFIASELISSNVITILTVVAGATLVYGNLAAIPQNNFKRLLAFSSISHAGFLLMALASTPAGGAISQFSISPVSAISFYLAAYLFMTLLAFLVMTLVRTQRGGESIDSFRGLAKTSPFLALTLLIAMMSLAGVPLTAGFIGKFYVFLLAVNQHHYWLVALGVVGAAAGFYYYLKVVRAMYWEAPEDTSAPAIEVSMPTKIALILLIVAVFIFGLDPAPLML